MEPPRRLTFGAPVLSMAEGEAGALAFGLSDGSVSVVEPDQARSWTAKGVHDGAVLHLAFHAPSRSFLSAGEDGRLCSIEGSGVHAERLRLGAKWIENLLVDPMTGQCAVSAGKELRILHPTLKPADTHRLPSAPGRLGWDRTRGRIAAPHYGGVSLIPWSALEGGGYAIWKGSHLSAAVSPDGRWLATGMQENALHVWPLDEDGEGLGMRGYRAKPRSLAWTADSLLLLSSGLDSVIAWRFDGEGPAGREPLAMGWVDGGLSTHVAAHPVAPAAAVGFDNGAVLFADLGARYAIALEEAGAGAVTTLGWSGDGLRLVIGREDGGVAIYDIAR